MTSFHPEMINTNTHDTDKLHFILCFFPLFLIYATLIVALSEFCFNLFHFAMDASLGNTAVTSALFINDNF